MNNALTILLFKLYLKYKNTAYITTGSLTTKNKFDSCGRNHLRIAPSKTSSIKYTQKHKRILSEAERCVFIFNEERNMN